MIFYISIKKSLLPFKGMDLILLFGRNTAVCGNENDVIISKFKEFEKSSTRKVIRQKVIDTYTKGKATV